ncbi:MAG: hypothetical protein U5N27_09645, partial [Rhizobium sp.]|nr:hypothetical protein [Rhizobium sp.]
TSMEKKQARVSRRTGPAIEARDELLCELEKNRVADCNVPELVASNGQNQSRPSSTIDIYREVSFAKTHMRDCNRCGWQSWASDSS